jgi:hypothetical protein
MPKETKAKFGDKITVTVKKGKKAKAPKKPIDDRRFGAPPFGDDVPREPPPPLITVHDMSQIFRQRNYRERHSSIALTGAAYVSNINPLAGDIFRWSEMFYEPNRAGFIGSQIGWHNVISQSLLRGPSNTGFPPLPANAGDPPTSDINIFDEIDVYAFNESFTEVDYRKNDFCWPLGKTALATGVTVIIGNKTAVVGGTGWIDKPQNPENKALEINSLDMPISVGVNAWARGARDYYSKPGAFRPRLPAGNHPVRIDAAGHFYESFNTADTTNYKVTSEPLYSAPEVSGRFPVRNKEFRVYLAPQMWKSAYDTPAYDVYEFARTLPPQKWFRYRAFVVRGELDADSRDRFRYGSDTTGESPFTSTTGTYLYEDKADFLTLPITATNFPHLESSADQIGLLAYSQLGWAFFRIWEAQGFTTTPEDATPISGNVVTTTTQTPAERLVGAIRVSDEKKFYVWRKTETERDLVTLYSGKVSPIAFAAETPIVDYINELTVPPQIEQLFPFYDFP